MTTLPEKEMLFLMQLKVLKSLSEIDDLIKNEAEGHLTSREEKHTTEELTEKPLFLAWKK